MAANYWIKLYIEILNDSKMAVLPDRLWREKIEAMVRDPNNIHCDPDDLRSEYLLLRNDLKSELFSRDEHKCAYCGSTDNLEIDHVIPLGRGGSNDISNLQILCRSCNRKKWKHL